MSHHVLNDFHQPLEQNGALFFHECSDTEPQNVPRPRHRQLMVGMPHHCMNSLRKNRCKSKSLVQVTAKHPACIAVSVRSLRPLNVRCKTLTCPLASKQGPLQPASTIDAFRLLVCVCCHRASHLKVENLHRILS